MAAAEKGLYPFHRANIHERRWAAIAARSVPLLMFVCTVVLLLVGLFHVWLLLWLCAVLNLTMWLWTVATAISGVHCSTHIMAALQETDKVLLDESQACSPANEAAKSKTDIESASASASTVHLIVFPNYKEDEETLSDTLESLSQAEGAKQFRVVLATEAREGAEGAKKAERLVERFSNSFAWLNISVHPEALVETHLDDSSDAEVPGKASNLKFAVSYGCDLCRKEGFSDATGIVLTVADADCLFHPKYFEYVGAEYAALRKAPGGQHDRTMWQAGQMPFRNYASSPLPSRSWGYIATLYEFAGVSALSRGGTHMVFSSYSMPLKLAMDAQPWDGDVIAEDHHCFLKCFYYSIYASAQRALEDDQGEASPDLLQVRPVMLPVKSTSVVSSRGYWQTWIERWHQASRHSQGVAELSYAMLAAYDTLASLPWRLWNFRMIFSMLRLFTKIIFMHVLPVLQAVALATLTIFWLAKGRDVPQCPERIYVAWGDQKGDLLICGLAGAWCLVWPFAIPMFMFGLANYCIFVVCNLQPAEAVASKKEAKKSLWHGSDGDLKPTCGSKRLTLFSVTAIDCMFLMAPTMVLYGFLPMLLAYIKVLIWGNMTSYVVASKAMSTTTYGTMSNESESEKDAAK
eukprot:gnl/TRDRNA2_/TRDRNA2_179172_c0_seq1.p1 gnl/TRDRNA2_/TRDRNA2_179172_c0~~gnl/TRDRNA2_/TRDRNA2_179172_c0_seq1.p1  ORF type:complete len:633 (-),score=86.58 gnl/TRDRNA2_/TRDRNA2_179172_c0_seq1:45-1943(-)